MTNPRETTSRTKTRTNHRLTPRALVSASQTKTGAAALVKPPLSVRRSSNKARAGMRLTPMEAMFAPQHNGQAILALAPQVRMPARNSGDPSGNSQTRGVNRCPSALPDVIAALVEWQRVRTGAQIARQRIENQTSAYVRRAIGWQGALAKTKEGESLKKKAERIVAAIWSDPVATDTPREDVDLVAPFCLMMKDAIAPIDTYLADVESCMARLARELPVWPWIAGVKGIAEITLAKIIGESGDLLNYANPGKLWKRFELHVYKGRAPSTWRKKGGLTAEEWIECGAAPERRAIAENVGTSLMRARGTYKAVYDERRAYENARTDANAAERPIVAHKRALRYMVKRFLRDLWRAWKDCNP